MGYSAGSMLRIETIGAVTSRDVMSVTRHRPPGFFVSALAADIHCPVGCRELFRRGPGLQRFPSLPKLRLGCVDIRGGLAASDTFRALAARPAATPFLVCAL